MAGDMSAEHLLIREMGITDANIERRKNAVRFGADDLARLAAIRDRASEPGNLRGHLLQTPVEPRRYEGAICKPPTARDRASSED